MGNSGLEKFREPLEHLAAFENPLVAGQARWALQQLTHHRHADYEPRPGCASTAKH